MNAQGSRSAAETAGQTTVEVGKVFGQAGTDGLILYALVLISLFMFIVALAAIWLGHRAAQRKDQQFLEAMAAKDKQFIEAADRQTEALTLLAGATATQTAVQANQTNTLARVEGIMARIPPGG